MLKIKHIRHATSIIEIDSKKILIDPVLADKESYPPIINTKNPRKNPLVDLPMEIETIMDVDGIIITHNHNDHFDVTAKKILPKDIPVLCQSEDYNDFQNLGFLNVTEIEENTKWLGFECERYKGYHGGHFFKNKLGISSSVYLKGKETDIYITGDTLPTFKVKKTLKSIKPENILANGGGARMKILGKLTMNNSDILNLCKRNPGSNIIAVHMDSINHCFDTRESLKSESKKRNIDLFIPDDGEEIDIKN